ncbi:endolytic transglycosylase MltG [Spirulina sp. CS-785/01]|uniref:endolytic transglycosylase MltG n=1 Tax=Spirulina sp. CS-785/01 TaxID=3021716 RepID=UPI00232F2F8C|nr:endolytic transglycosylase MltG [Spirulina sp. CS-785/01]MDB9312727.1 endolytic transglycosylase MltG [Spirulina sp. CS-785/01]
MKSFANFSKWLYTLVILPGILVISAWQGLRWWHWASSPVVSPSSTTIDTAAMEAREEQLTVLMDVPLNTSNRQIGQDLEAAGLIHSSWAWNIWVFWLALLFREGSFQAGVYELTPTDSMPEIAEMIWEGQVVERRATVIEGWSSRDMAAYFEQRGYFSKEAFLETVKTFPQGEYNWLPPNLETVEGFLYPDTYQLPNSSVSPEAVIQQMLNRFEEVALPIYQQNEPQTNLSLKDWVTLASIIEKEAAVPEERKTIAGVFTNRLQQGMKLEADPTVEYALEIEQTPDQPLTFDQVETPHPYNTYVNSGLPPGPIANPSKASLEAALNPEPTEYLYFVARYDGTHAFSRTLEEHEAAKNRIRQEREQRQSS